MMGRSNKMRKTLKRRAYKESAKGRIRKPMRESIMVEVDEEEFLDMLLDRLKTWTDDYTALKLYEQMYQDYIDGGVFETVHEGIAVIVDNDWVNYCTILTEEDSKYDDRYDECVELIEEGEREGDGFTIEAYLGDKDTGYAILIRNN